MKSKVFKLAVLATNNALVLAIKNLCLLSSMSSARGRSYEIVAGDAYADADIVLLSHEDPTAVARWNELNAAYPSKPLVLVTDMPDLEARAGQYILQRSRLSGAFLKLLDVITSRELSFAPEMVIGETGSSLPLPVKHDDKFGVTMALKVAKPPVASVLVIDDSHAVRTQMTMCMELYNVAVETAENAAAGLVKASKNKYDVIFMDVIMPDMDGYRACKLIKANGAIKNTPVVMLTSKSTAFDKVRGMMAGCDRYLTKPADNEAVKQVLKQFVPAL